VPLIEIVVLALVQGITEFLPISSSAHLILVPRLTDWPDQGLLVDVAVHVGTLGAVLLYFWRDVLRLVVGAGHLATLRRTPDSRLTLYLVLATVPVVVVGFLAQDVVAGRFRSMALIGWTTLGFGLVLLLADRLGMRIRRLEHLTLGSALTIGLAQVLALVPGVSRSGITMTAARALGFERTAAARFSMLLSMPTIAGAGVLAGLELAERGDLALQRDAVLAAALAFVAALAAIAALMRWVERHSFTPFVAYRVALGAALLGWVYA